jgi:predicted transglutaminase-like cysteine proteinase
MGPCAALAAPGAVRIAWHLGATGRRAVFCCALALLAALAMLEPSRAWDADRMRHAAKALGPQAEAATRALQDLLAETRALDHVARVAAINGHFNRHVAFNEDAVIWQQADYWASPLETIAKGEGDCEDYAIAKYFALVAAGIPVASLRLVYARAMLPATPALPARTQAHMVLAYYADNPEDPMILDNLVQDLRRASRRGDLTPVFSFNSEGLWQGGGTQSAGDPVARLSRWREVLRKARAEGFL